VCYAETMYHPLNSVAGGLTTGIHTLYVDLSAGVLCRDFAAQRRYAETI
jgi:hypothetical protein